MATRLSRSLTELVSGRPVPIDDQGSIFRLDSLETRSILEWYRCNQRRWGGRIMKEDVEGIVDALSIPPRTFDPISVLRQSGQSRVLHLKSIRIHRFAGIHSFGQPGQQPEEFFFEVESPLTIVEGINGSGKTSLLSAITWCLTGKVYRSQRPPENLEACRIGTSCDPNNDDPEEPCLADISTVTPLPPKSVLKFLDGNRVQLDTWVELQIHRLESTGLYRSTLS